MGINCKWTALRVGRQFLKQRAEDGEDGRGGYNTGWLGVAVEVQTRREEKEQAAVSDLKTIWRYKRRAGVDILLADERDGQQVCAISRGNCATHTPNMQTENHRTPRNKETQVNTR